MLLRHRNRRYRAWWYEFTDWWGEPKVGICSSRAQARRYARMLGGRYRGRWRFDR